MRIPEWIPIIGSKPVVEAPTVAPQRTEADRLADINKIRHQQEESAAPTAVIDAQPTAPTAASTPEPAGTVPPTPTSQK